jgi:hypothetical protein
MTSWRDSMTPEGQADMDQLLDAALPFAQESLTKHGEFFPYAISLSDEGEIAVVMGHPGVGGEHPRSSDVLDFLYQALMAKRDSIRAAAVVSDVRLREPAGDAIRVEIEHREGAVIAVLLPYAKKRFGRGITFGELIATAGERHFWQTR